MSSTVVDERVVEMRFDNEQFERNVGETMSTLKKLKKSLKLDGASKGLGDISAAAKKCDVSCVERSIESVRASFSALGIVGATTLANITNSAVNAGKRIVSALTIDPVKTGFDEYETKIDAIQTIMSNTASKGTTMADVTKTLDELNTYADKTIYNFAEMTRNIGTFTAAGVDLKTSATAIQGIANLAAASGSSSMQASTAMYQLSQALAAGTVKLQDWNSVVNAGMGGEKFQEALKETARRHGVAVDKMIEKNGSFRESLQEGWITADILNETLNNFTVKGATEYASSMQKAGKWTKKQADAFVAEAQSMEDAATKVKTFTQLWDTLKESAQSGWSQSWEIIVGDFEEAKELFTEASDLFGGIIGKSADARNRLLEGALSSKWESLSKRISDTGISMDDFQEKLKDTAKSHGIAIDKIIKEEGSLAKAFSNGKLSGSLIVETLKKMAGVSSDAAKATENATAKMKDFQSIVNKVVRGDFGNGEDRVKALTKAGYDYATIQELVNKTLAGEKVSFDKLSDAQLKNMGYTDKQITAVRKLAEEAEKTGTPLNELIADLEKPSGRELMIDSLRNAINGVIKSIGAVRDAWEDVFPPMTSDQLYNIIDGIHTFSEYLVISDEKADKLKRTAKGLFAALDIVTTITGGALKTGLKLFCKLLGAADVDVLGITASVGDAVVAFRDWLFEGNIVAQTLNKIGDSAVAGVGQLRSWIDAFVSLPEIRDNIAKFERAFGASLSELGAYFDGGIERFNAFIERVKAMDSISLDDLDDIFQDFMENVVGYFGNIGGCFDDAKTAVGDFKESTKRNLSEAGEGIDNVKTKILDFVAFIKEKIGKNIGVGEILTVGIGGGLMVFTKKIGDVLETLAGPVEAFTDIFENFGGMLKSCSKAINAFTLKTKSQALINVAIAIGVLTASVTVLTLLDQEKMWSAVGAIGALAAGLLALSAAMGAIGKIGGTKASVSILGMAASLLILTGALKTMEKLDGGKAWENVKILGALSAGLLVVCRTLSKTGAGSSKGALSMVGFVLSLKLLIDVLEDIEKKNPRQMAGTIPVLLGMVAGLALLSAASKKAKASSGLGLIAMVAALKVFIGVFDDVADLDANGIKKNMDVLVAIFASFAGLMAASAFAGKNAAKAGVGILAMSGAVVLLMTAFKMMSDMDAGELSKATDTVSQLLAVFAGVMALSAFAGKNAAKAGAMFLLMSGAIGILSGVIVVLSHIEPDGLDRAVGAITTLGVMFGAITALTGLAKECKGTLVLLSVTVGLLSVALGALSMIEPTGLQAASQSLSMLIGTFALLVASTNLAKKANGTIILLTAVVGALGGILYLLSDLPVESTLGISTALSELLTSLSVSCLVLSAAGKLGGATAGVKAMIKVVLAVGTLMAGIGALVDYFPELESFLDTGLVILEKIGAGLGAFAGNFIGGFSAGATAGFGAVGEHLGQFMTNAAPFFDGLKNVDANMGQSAENIASAVLALAKANFTDALSGIFGKHDAGEFAKTLGDLGTGLVEFSNNIDGVNPDAVKSASEALSTLAAATNSIPNEGGLLGKALGENDVGAFANKLGGLGTGLNAFSEQAVNVDVDAVKSASEALTALAAATDSIPNEGGLLGSIFGENDALTFANKLGGLGTGLNAFSDQAVNVDVGAVKGASEALTALAAATDSIPNEGGLLGSIFGENDALTFANKLGALGNGLNAFSEQAVNVDVDAVKSASEALTALAAATDSIPNEGGLIGGIFGENDALTFANKLSALGNGLNVFSEQAVNVDVGAVKSASEALTILADATSEIPNEKGLLGGIFGDNDAGAFGDKLSKLGLGLNSFANNTSSIKTAGIRSAAEALRVLGDLSDEFREGGLKGFFDGIFSGKKSDGESVKKQLMALGQALKGFFDEISGIKTSDVAGVASNIKSVMATLKDALSIDAGSAGSFNQSMTDLANAGIDSFVNVFTKESSYIKQIVSTYLADTPVATIRSKYADFNNAGKYVVEGFAKGIADNAYLAEAKAKAMASAAENAARSELQVHSPSKKFSKIGSYAAEGLAEGIEKTKNKATKAVKKLVQSATEPAKNITDSLKGSADSFDEYAKDAAKSGTSVQKTVKKTEDSFKSFRDTVKESIEGATGLFDAFEVETDVAGKDLLQNLRSQIVGIRDWASEIQTLAARGVSGGLLKELSKMGPSSAKYTTALVTLTDKELKKLNKLYGQRLSLNDQATEQIASSFSKGGQKASDAYTRSMSKAFEALSDSIKKSIEDATEVFDAFEVETDVAGKDLLQNLRSQIVGIRDWAENIQILADRGLNKGLLKALSDMGPSGAKYAAALASMTDKELKKMNQLYKQRLSLNGKAADEIASTFMEGGKKASASYAKGVSKTSKNLVGVFNSMDDSLNKGTLNPMPNVIGEIRDKINDLLGWTFQNAVKNMAKGMSYGAGAFRHFCSEYLTSTKNIALGTKAIEAASKVITSYGEKLYKESDYYKEDTATLKTHKKELKSLRTERSKLQKELAKAQKTNTTASKARAKALKNELKTNLEAIKDAKKQIKADEKDIANHTKEVFNNLKTNLADTFSSFLDPLAASLESGVDLFSKYESNTDLYEADKKNLEEHQKSLEDLEKRQKEIQDEISKYADLNTLAARKRVKELKEQLAEVEESIEDAKESIKQDEDDMASHSEVTVDSILENMQSQVDGISKWQKNLEALSQKGVSQGLLDKLKGMGVDGADYVEQFLKMSDEELKRANDLFSESENLSSQALIRNLQDNMDAAKDWVKDIQKLAAQGFDQALIEQLGDMGPDSADYVNALLSMTPEQAAEFNKKYAEALKLPDTMANEVISSYAYAGSKSVAEFTTALSELTRKGSDSNAAFVSMMGEIGKTMADALAPYAKTAGKTAGNTLTKAVSSSSGKAKEASNKLGTAVVKEMKGVLSSAEGKNVASRLLSGLKDGLARGTSAVAEAARKVAQSAYDAAKKTLGIHSPSKKFAELGSYAFMGFVNGMRSLENDTYKTAVDIMGATISAISEAANANVDVQPVIRPVLDLTDVQNGASGIDGMMDGYALAGSVRLAQAANNAKTSQGDYAFADALRKIEKTLSGLAERPGIEQNNTFSISGNDPKAIADEISHVLQQQVERRRATWA